MYSFLALLNYLFRTLDYRVRKVFFQHLLSSNSFSRKLVYEAENGEFTAMYSPFCLTVNC